MTGMLFLIPFVRHIYTYCRAHPVDKSTFKRHLREKHTCVFIPGGVQEVVFVSNDPNSSITLFLNSRKGFVSLAIEVSKGKPGAAVGDCAVFLTLFFFFSTLRPQPFSSL